MNIPSNYQIHLFPGGALSMFSAVGFNLFNKENPVAMSFTTGFWSYAAAVEQARLGTVHNVLPTVTKDNLGISTLPEEKDWHLLEKADFLHYCDNETVTGFEIHDFPFDKF
jgi:phosphoserine aminotransferase